MKKTCLFLIVVILAACNAKTGADNVPAADSTASASSNTTDTLCYVHAEGIGDKKDVTMLKLIITGDSVIGLRNYMPYEKDRKTGTIAAKKEGDYITGTWHYMQEGINEAAPVAFKLMPHHQLLEKRHAYDTQTGAMYLPDTAFYSVSYVLVDCKQ